MLAIISLKRQMFKEVVGSLAAAGSLDRLEYQRLSALPSAGSVRLNPQLRIPERLHPNFELLATPLIPSLND